MTLLEALVRYCISGGQVEGDGVDAFRDFMPEAPDSVVSFIEYEGSPASPYTDIVHRSVQIKVRSRSSDAARSKAVALYKLFIQRTEDLCIYFTQDLWGQVYVRQTPFKLQQDNSDRTIYCFNLGISTNILE